MLRQITKLKTNKLIINRIDSIIMDNSVNCSACFQNYTDREFWTKCVIITRMVYNLELNLV